MAFAMATRSSAPSTSTRCAQAPAPPRRSVITRFTGGNVQAKGVTLSERETAYVDIIMASGLTRQLAEKRVLLARTAPVAPLNEWGQAAVQELVSSGVPQQQAERTVASLRRHRMF